MGSTANITSYALIIKRGSLFIPNYFGIIIPDHDRALFLLKEIPNNQITPSGIMRKLLQEDIHSVSLNSGLKSLDKTSWADLWYETKVRDIQVFVFEKAQRICGFISFFMSDKNKILIDGIAVDQGCQGQYIGANLMRWAETWARSSNCSEIELWAIDSEVSFYKKMHFKEKGNEHLDLGDEKYTLMYRKLLYHLEDDCYFIKQ